MDTYTAGNEPLGNTTDEKNRRDKTMKKMITALLLTITALTACFGSALADTGDYVHFVPTAIEVESSEVTVEGYFVNLNTSKAVKNMENFTMDVYYNGENILSGEFGTINSFTVAPLSVVYQSFTFRGESGLNVGDYVANDSFYATWGGNFTSFNY